MAAEAEHVGRHGTEHAGHSASVFAHEPGTWLHPIAKALHLPDYVIVSWFIILALTLFAILATRRRSLVPGKLQCMAEMIIEGLNNYLRSIIGDEGPKYAPLISSLFIYILCINMVGLIPGMVSPSANPNTTVALALLTFVCVQTIAVFKLGPRKYAKHFWGEGLPGWLAPIGVLLGFLMVIIHVIGELAKPLSLGFRLLGNIFGEDMVIVQLVAIGVLIMHYVHFPIPVQFPLMLFGLFTSFVQALVFSTLAAIYISLFVAHHGEQHERGYH